METKKAASRSSGRSRSRLAAGLLIWGVAAGGVTAVAAARGGELRGPGSRLVRYAMHSPRRVTVELLSLPDPAGGWTLLAPGDPVVARSDRTYVGSVESVGPLRADGVSPLSTPVFTAVIALDPEVDPSDLEGAPYQFETSSGDLAWVLETLLPEAKREQIRHELQWSFTDHSEEIAQVLRPIGEDVLEHTMTVLDTNLAPVLKAHEKEIQALLDRHRETFKDELLPVLKSQLGPSVKEKARPIMTKIGRELWDQLPMWDLSWSLFRDKLPWQQKSYVDEWWSTFLETKAIPIVKEHEEELMKAGENLLQEGIRDPKVRAAFGAAWRRLAKDPEFKKLVRAIVEDALIRPYDASGLAKKLFADEGHRARFAALEQSFAPTLRRIARLVSMDERTNGLSPDLARVLRRIVFGKDARWVAVAATGPIRRVSDGSELAPAPARATSSPASVGSGAASVGSGTAAVGSTGRPF